MTHPVRLSGTLLYLTARGLALWLLVAAPAAAQLGTDFDLDIRQIDFGEPEEVSDRFGTTLVSGDFNGDGFADLAIGTPDENIGGEVDAGAVYVVYGSVFGLGLGPYQTLHQNSANMSDAAEAGDRFGAALAAGDIDDDGRDDLAIGVPGENSGGVAGAGAVHVVYGSPSGLSALNNPPDSRDDEVWSQADGALPGSPEAGDAFGSALTLGDFDGDGHADLVIGTPGENADTGEVAVLEGWFAGLFPAGEVRDAGSDGVDGDRFGAALATDRPPGDDPERLWVGAPGENGASLAIFVYSSTQGSGLSLSFSAFSLSQFGEGSEAGAVLATGDFGGAGGDELAVGVPRAYEDDVGAVWVFEQTGFATTFQQGLDGTLEDEEPFDRFGEALATGDFDGDGLADLVTGVPGENLYDGTPGQKLDAGVVHAHYGSADGLSSAGNQVWNLDTPGIDYGTSANDRFGAALAAGDFNGDGADDLAIGVPGADLDASAAGLVYVLEGFTKVVFTDGFESGDLTRWSVSVP